MPFFVSLGFALPSRKGTADFLQEITSRKDQRQYWADHSKPYRFIPPAEMAEAFRRSPVGQAVAAEIASPPARTKQGLSSHCKKRRSLDCVAWKIKAVKRIPMLSRNSEHCARYD